MIVKRVSEKTILLMRMIGTADADVDGSAKKRRSLVGVRLSSIISICLALPPSFIKNEFRGRRTTPWR